MEEWLDVPQLAKETKIPATTIHRYLNNFKQFFTYKGGKRSRRYNSSAIAVLLRIKDLYSKGFGTEEVEKKLSKEFPALLNNEQAETEIEETNLPALATTEDVTELKEAFAKQTELLKLLIQEREEERKEQKKFQESVLQFITRKDDTSVKSLSDPEQREIIQKVIQEELGEVKQHQQRILESLTEKQGAKEGEKEVAAVPIEEKKKGNFFSRFFK